MHCAMVSGGCEMMNSGAPITGKLSLFSKAAGIGIAKIA